MNFQVVTTFINDNVIQELDNPYCVAISNNDDQLNNGKINGCKLASISRLDEKAFTYTHKFNFTINAVSHSKTKGSNFQEYNDENILIVSKRFSNHFKIIPNENLYLKLVNKVPLDNITIGVSKDETYKIISNKKWLKELLKYASQNTVLCRAGDKITIKGLKPGTLLQDYLFEDMILLEGFPTCQGIITKETSITVIKMDGFPTSYLSGQSSENGAQSLSLRKTKKSHMNYLDLMSFTSNLIFGFPHMGPKYLNPLLNSITSNFFILQSQKHRFHVQILAKPSLLYLRNYALAFDQQVDPFNTIFIMQDAITKLGLKEGNWVKIKLYNPHAEQSLKIKLEEVDNIKSEPFAYDDELYRYAMICSTESWFKETSLLCNETIAYITPVLWYNLNHHPCYFQPNDTILILDTAHMVKRPQKYVEEAHVSIVESPNYSNHINCSLLLKRYFSTTRYICLGDIICLNSEDDPYFHTTNKDTNNSKWPVIHYNISMLEGKSSFDKGTLINNSISSLYQAGTIHRYIPVVMENYFFSNYLEKIVDTSSPPGFEKYCRHLEKHLLSFLYNPSQIALVSPHILMVGAANTGKSIIIRSLCLNLSLHLVQIDCQESHRQQASLTEMKLITALNKASCHSPCIIHLRHLDSLIRNKDVGDIRVHVTLAETIRKINEYSNHPVIVIATAYNDDNFPLEFTSLFLQVTRIKALSEDQRSLILKSLFSNFLVGKTVCVNDLAKRTAGFTLGDILQLMMLSRENSWNRIELFFEKPRPISDEDTSSAGIVVTNEDFEETLENLRNSQADSLGCPKIPCVKWEDVGGLENVKQEIIDMIQLPMLYPEQFALGLRCSGILLYGPPGTGKTLLAKAVATEFNINFISIKGPELINMYIGQSEENVREVFTRAKNASPCIIFFDELDSLAPNRGGSGDSGGVMDRVVSQLLAELDSSSNESKVFVIGATNRPDLLDPALLRPGRFDRLLYVGLPEDKSSRIHILKALTRKFKMSADVDLNQIEELCPRNLSGADFYSLCSGAMMISIKKQIEQIEKGTEENEDQELIVKMSDFVEAINNTIPSVSPKDIIRYMRIKEAKQ